MRRPSRPSSSASSRKAGSEQQTRGRERGPHGPPDLDVQLESQREKACETGRQHCHPEARDEGAGGHGDASSREHHRAGEEPGGQELPRDLVESPDAQFVVVELSYRGEERRHDEDRGAGGQQRAAKLAGLRAPPKVTCGEHRRADDPSEDEKRRNARLE